MKLAIIGRPNVGKSALYNRILGRRFAIVAEEEGVTRDRLSQEGELFGQPFTIIDSGGIDPYSKKDFNQEVLEQALQAIKEADSLIMVVDTQIGVTKLDELVASLLLKTGKPLTLAVNKIDDFQGQEIGLSDFYKLGIKKMVAVSALQGLNIAELVEMALEKKIKVKTKVKKAKTEEKTEKEKEKEEVNKEIETEEQESLEIKEDSESNPELKSQSKASEQILKVAILGRSNTGKSTLLNFLLKEKRVAVSKIPGTTRDNIDVLLETDQKKYILIDTAGIRRRNKEKSAVEKFAHLRTEAAIKRADICLLMLDSQEALTDQDKKIMTTIKELGKGCLVLLNKWDLMSGVRMEHFMKDLKEKNAFLKEYPTLFISAKKGRNTNQIFSQVEMIKSNLEKRISTGELNQFMQKCLQKYHPPMIQGRRLRIYYLTQVKIVPPRFVLFVNQPSLMQKTYQKYLISRFREAFSFLGAPLFFEIKGKKVRAKN